MLNNICMRILFSIALYKYIVKNRIALQTIWNKIIHTPQYELPHVLINIR